MKKYNIVNFILAVASFSALLWGCKDGRGSSGNFAKGTVSYGVECFGGVPFIVENGRPVRGRILWIASGGTGTARHDFLSRTGEWRVYEWQFESPNDASAVLQLRMGEFSGNVLLSKIEVRDAATRKVLRSIKFDGAKPDKNLSWWCRGFRKNPPLEIANVKVEGAENGALSIKMKSDPKLEGLHFYTGRIPVKKGGKYIVSLRGKSDVVRPFGVSIYRNRGTLFECLGSDVSVGVLQVKHAASVGVNFVSFEIDSVWTKPNEKPDFSHIDVAFKRILNGNPNAKLIPRVRLDPQTRKWWRDLHRDDLLKNSDGSSNEMYVSMSSPNYRRESRESLRAFIEYCQKNYPDNIAGYHPAGGNSREWFYGGTWYPEFGGYDIHTAAAWKKWAQKKYGTVEKLNAAWKSRFASFEDVAVPAAARRCAPDALIDPSKFAEISDFNFFLEDEMSDTVLGLAKVVREAAPDKLSIFFFGYGFEFSRCAKGPAYSGHYALRKILDSPDIDALAGPISYNDRNFGDGKSTMGATESVIDSGKLWIDEDDTTTHLGIMGGRDYPGKYSGIKTQKDSLEVLRRNLAQETIRNTGVWWMDLRNHGWFDDPVLWKEMARFAAPETDAIRNPVPYRPQMRLIMDDRSMMFVGARGFAGRTSGRLMDTGRICANRSGVPFGHYLLDDALKTPTAAKLNVFLSAYALDSGQRIKMAQLREKSSCAFAWATGLVDLDKNAFSLDAVKEATGFEVSFAKVSYAEATSTPEGLKLGILPKFGDGKRRGDVYPILTPKLEKGDIVLAVYADKSPAVVMRRSGKHPMFFCGAPFIPAALYRAMADAAGAHIYVRNGNCVYANGAYVSLTATSDGVCEIDFASTSDIFDALSGERLGAGPKLKFDMKKGDCKFFRIGAGNAHIKKY